MNPRAQFAEQIRLLPGVRAQPNYDEVEISWDNLNKQLKAIAKGFAKLSEAMAELGDMHDLEEGEDLRLMLNNMPPAGRNSPKHARHHLCPQRGDDLLG